MSTSNTVEPIRSERSSYQGDEENEGGDICGMILAGISILLILCTFPISLFLCVKVAQEYERAVIFRLGRVRGRHPKGPGLFFIIPCIETFSIIDQRTVFFDIPPQEVLTRDSVTISVDAVVYYRVADTTLSVANVENAHESTCLLAQTTLRNELGTRSLAEILQQREVINSTIKNNLRQATTEWGIVVERVEVKDIHLPEPMQRSMAAEAEAGRQARARVIAADGEKKASEALKEASKVIGESEAALQLRYLQTMNAVSKDSIILFPVFLNSIG